ncbi:uncharacterized protein [Diadema setosum]|uniref:uncharacterized protein n=1 Tax=Diadema setosum TaxID=31175 RepID=UPI003B3A6F9D
MLHCKKMEPGKVLRDNEGNTRPCPNSCETTTRTIESTLSDDQRGRDRTGHVPEAEGHSRPYGDHQNSLGGSESSSSAKENSLGLETGQSLECASIPARQIDQSESIVSEDSSISYGTSKSAAFALQLDLNHSEGEWSTVKCAGCGKNFEQPFVIAQKANRIVLSLCDDCQNITSAMFLCNRCGQECDSLALLRAHKQTHLLPNQRTFVCQMCGVGFSQEAELDDHMCDLASSETTNLIVKDKAGCVESTVGQKSLRKKPKEQKVRVEAIVKTLTRRSQATRTSKTQARIPSTCKSQTSKQICPDDRILINTRAKSNKQAVNKTAKVSPPIRQTRLSAIKFVKPPANRAPVRKKVLKPPKVFQCLECSEFFTDGKEFRKHKVTHKKKETFHCPTCQKEFKSKGNLKRHEGAHSGQQTNICDICNKKFQSAQNLLTHKRTVHTDEKPFSCDICKKAFKQLGNMKTHRRTHTGEKPFLCKECGRPFAQMGNLQAHMVIHAASKPHVCEICGKSFSYLRSLQNHRRGTHTGERPFACNICGKTFSNPSVLRDHKRTHSDKRGYLCDKCGKGFKSYKNLKQHEKFHLEVRPYSCQECGKGFVWFKSFQLHKRTHTGEKPYSCEQCDKQFSNINSLKNHRQKHLTGSAIPATKKRPNATAAPQPAELLPQAPPPPPAPPAPYTLPSQSSQSMLIPHPSLHQGQTRDQMHNSMHTHSQPQVPSSSSPSATTPMHPSLPPHSQAYGHVVFPHTFPSFVTNAGGDFTIL